MWPEWTRVECGAPGRVRTCDPGLDFVHVRHADGVTALYYYLKNGSVGVTLGQARARR